ncbi:hypothetical protein IKQ_05155 [Bacillus cereus VDM053]|nr:hypothetical protein IKQ_05155 [Bacillus cereus VDM053]
MLQKTIYANYITLLNMESLYLLMFLTSINFYVSILVLINLWFIRVVLVSYYAYYQGDLT